MHLGLTVVGRDTVSGEWTDKLTDVRGPSGIIVMLAEELKNH